MVAEVMNAVKKTAAILLERAPSMLPILQTL